LLILFRTEGIDSALIHAIESVVIDWSHQIQEVLKKDSSQPLLEGQNPGPLVEVEFWKAKALNLENIYEQVNLKKSYVM
jgi:dynein heavy chain, axonemal